MQCHPDPGRNPTPKTISFKYATVSIMFSSPTLYTNPAITSMNGKPRLIREKNTIPLLFKLCMCPINTIYTVTKTQPTYGRRALSPLWHKRFCTVWADIQLLCEPLVLAAVAVAVWKRLRRLVF